MAAPGTEKTDQASKVESPTGRGAPAAKAAAPQAPQAKPGPRKGRPVLKLFVSALVLAALAGGAGYAALTFRDVDPRIDAVANYLDGGLNQARGLLDKGQAVVAGLTGQTAKPDAGQEGSRALLDKSPATGEPAAPETGETQKSAEAPPPPPAPESREAAAPEPASPAETRPAETKPAETRPAEAPPAEIRPAEKPTVAESVEPKPLEAKPVEARPSEAAPALAAKGVDADGFSDRDLINALEGRIDALGDEVKALRERLDAPKNETRAAPEAEAPKSTLAPAAADASGAAVVLAFALQRDLEAGRPFADEIAAYSRLGVEPAPSPALIEIAEKGAPTGAQLREAFLPVSKKIQAHESQGGQESGALTEHLLQGASKLVKVRPTGEAEPESLEGKLHRIDAALTHNDFGAAVSLYDSLPEAAREESKDFGATLRQRAEAARAADELLHGAIAALGKK